MQRDSSLLRMNKRLEEKLKRIIEENADEHRLNCQWTFLYEVTEVNSERRRSVYVRESNTDCTVENLADAAPFTPLELNWDFLLSTSTARIINIVI